LALTRLFEAKVVHPATKASGSQWVDGGACLNHTVATTLRVTNTPVVADHPA
jgi:hypothetical protein